MSESTSYTNGAAPSDSAPDLRAAANRAAVNQANAQHSTGPRTDARKQHSSLNALRHRLTGHVIVLPSEEHAAYETPAKRFFDDLQPKGALEQQLAQSLADTSGGSTASPPLPLSVPSPAVSMHEHRLSRQFERALNQLREIQSERREAEEKQIERAAELFQLDQDAGLPYNPAEDGFVFSSEQIQTHVRRRDRRSEAFTADAQRRYS